MNRYPIYKEIKLPWLTSIPAHWSVVRNKNIFIEMDDVVGENAQLYTLLSLTLNGIIPRDMQSGKGKFPKDFDTYKIVKKGDMAFCLFDIDETPRTVGLSQYDGMLTGAYTILRIKKANAKFVYYYYLALDNVKALRPLYKGLRKTISVNAFMGINFPLPPRDEQEQIVHFLDWKVSEINNIIENKKKQVSIFKELLNTEIEKQLYAYPIIKTVRLKELGIFFKGGGFSRDNLVNDTKYPAVLYGDIYTQYKYKTAVIRHYINADAYKESRKMKNGDIVMAGTGETKDEIGKSILYTGNQIVAVGGDVIVFRPNENINSEYLLYQLYSQAALKHRYINGKGDIIVHIYPNALGNTLIPLCDEISQIQVVKRIDEIINQTNNISNVLHKEISILKEFKTRLITKVVTGQIDVRNIHIPNYEFLD